VHAGIRVPPTPPITPPAVSSPVLSCPDLSCPLACSLSPVSHRWARQLCMWMWMWMQLLILLHGSSFQRQGLGDDPRPRLR
jgi:hypothetical protein